MREIPHDQLSQALPKSPASPLLDPRAAFGMSSYSSAHEGILPVPAPAPAIDEAAPAATETAVFAGGCFWGVQGVFQHVKGVTAPSPAMRAAPSTTRPTRWSAPDTTGHAESVKVTFDPKLVSYGKLLQIFFSVVTDPTTLNYQGNDYGTQLSLGAVHDERRAGKVAKAYIAQLDAAKVYPAKIVTEVTPYSNFYQAEDYHQDNAYTMKVNPGYLAVLRRAQDRRLQGEVRRLLGRQARPGLRLERLSSCAPVLGRAGSPARLSFWGTQWTIPALDRRRLPADPHIAMILGDGAGHIRFWNAGAEALFGHSHAEALGHRVDLVVPARLSRHALDRLQPHHRLDLERRRWLWAPSTACTSPALPSRSEVLLTPLRDADGKVEAVFAMFRRPKMVPAS